MKIKTLWSQAHGQAILQVLIALSVIAGIALTMTKNAATQRKSAQTVEKKMGLSVHMSEMKDVLTSRNNCKATFSTITVTGLPKTFPTVFLSDGATPTPTTMARWTAGTAYDGGAFTLTSMTMNTFTVNPLKATEGELLIKVLWTKLGTFFGPADTIQDLTVRVTIDGANTITDCYTSFEDLGGGTIWYGNSGQGIYYSKAAPASRVAIGTTPNAGSVALLQVEGSAMIGTYAKTSSADAYALGGQSMAARSLAIGEHANAFEIGGIAIGSDSSSTGVNAPQTPASAFGAIAIGSANTWAPSGVVADNRGPLAVSNGSIAIGSASDLATKVPGAHTNGDYAIAVGTDARAYEDYSIAMGAQAHATTLGVLESGLRPYGIAIGPLTEAHDSYSLSIGYAAKSGQETTDTNVDNAYAIAIGSLAQAFDYEAIAIGEQSIAGQTGEDNVTTNFEGDGAIAIGRMAHSYDQNTLAIGKSASAGSAVLNTSWPYGVAIGSSAVAGGNRSIAVGPGTLVNSPYSIAVGPSADLSAGSNYSTAVGQGISSNLYTTMIGANTTTVDESVSIGATATTLPGAGALTGAVAIGHLASAEGKGIAIGPNADADSGSVVIGSGNHALAFHGLAMGGADITNTSAAYNIAFGYNADMTGAFTSAMVISNGNYGAIAATQADEFKAHFRDGFKFCTGPAGTTAVACAERFEILANGTTQSFSDVNSKQDFELVDADAWVERFFDIDVYWWNYKTDPGKDDRMIGPMAQDFKRAFGTHGDDRHINQVDADGVMMAGIHGLAIKNQKLEERIPVLQAQNQEMRERLVKLEGMVEKLRQRKLAGSSTR